MLNQFSQWKKGGEGCVWWDMISLICQHVATLQFDSCAEKDSLCGTVMMARNLTCLDQCHGVRSWRKLLPRLAAKELLYRLQGQLFHPDSQEKQEWILEPVIWQCSMIPPLIILFFLNLAALGYRLNLIHEFTSFFSTKVIFAGMPKKTFPRKQAFVDRNRTTEPIARMNVVWKVEKAEHTEFKRANMWQYCSLSAAQRQTAPIANGGQQTDLSSVAHTWGFCTNMYDIVICVSLWLGKQRQRFAQGQLKGYFETKVFELLLNHAKSIIPMKERWGRLRRWWDMIGLICQHVATLQFDSCAEKDSLCGTVMMAWIWHVWINAL